MLSCLICNSNLQSSCEFSIFALAGIESFSKLGDSIYFEEKGGTPALSIIQYIPSTFNWKTAGLTVIQQLEPLSSLDLHLQVSVSISAKVILLNLSCLKLYGHGNLASLYSFFFFERELPCTLFVQTNGQSATLNVRIPSWSSATGAKATLNNKDLGLVTPGITI
jgi:hypothetical protein